MGVQVESVATAIVKGIQATWTPGSDLEKLQGLVSQLEEYAYCLTGEENPDCDDSKEDSFHLRLLKSLYSHLEEQYYVLYKAEKAKKALESCWRD